MRQSRPINRSRRLLPQVVIGLLVLLLVLAINGSMELLGSVRALVHGEALWSKAQKEAVLAMHRLDADGHPDHWRAFSAALDVAAGDRQARLEILGEDAPDMRLVHDGFRRGGLSDAVIPGTARTLRGFRWLPFVAEAVAAWERADVLAEELRQAGAELRGLVRAGAPAGQRHQVLVHIDALDRRLTREERRFSQVLNTGAGRVETAIRGALVSLVLLIVLASVLALRYSQRAIRHREQALDTERRRYRGVVDRIGDVVFDTGADGRLALVSRAWQRLTGLDDSALIGQRISDLSCSNLDPAVEQALLAGALDEHRWEFSLETAEHGERVFAGHISALWDAVPDARVLTGTLSDVTLQREAEVTTAHRNRMEAMGQLAGGVAHDFNNMLTGIIGFSGLARADLAGRHPGDPALAQLDQVLRSAEAAAGLSRQLLTFSKPPQVDEAVSDLNKAVQASARLLGHLLPETVQLRVDALASQPVVALMATQVEQLVMNLVINARDAMPQGGRVLVATRDLPQGGVELRVSDQGCGMDSITRRRIFEPFFTTKPRHRGTGMGLATVYGIVSHAGGRIDVDSAPGEGATFILQLPAGTRAPQDRARPETPVLAAARGHRALVVEDDPGVRELVCRTLELNGFEVTSAGNGCDGLELLLVDTPPDLLVSDVVMPSCTGPAMWQQAWQRGVVVPTLFMSGYTDDALDADLLAEPGVAFLTKPFRPGDLLDSVAELVGRPALDDDSAGVAAG